MWRVSNSLGEGLDHQRFPQPLRNLGAGWRSLTPVSGASSRRFRRAKAQPHLQTMHNLLLQVWLERHVGHSVSRPLGRAACSNAARVSRPRACETRGSGRVGLFRQGAHKEPSGGRSRRARGILPPPSY